jgi:hypothetical protein
MSRSFTHVKQFKKAIYTTNHCNTEKDLLFKENLRQTIRFAPANAFSNAHYINALHHEKLHELQSTYLI